MAAGDDEFDADEWLARQFGQPPPASGNRSPEHPPTGEPAPPPAEPVEPVEPAAPPPLVEPPFPVHPDIPTQAMDLSEFEQRQDPALPPEQPMFRSRRRRAEPPPSVDPALEGTEVFSVPEAVGVPAPQGEGSEPPPTGQDLDALFGAGAFQEYADEPVLQTARQPRVAAPAADRPRAAISRTQKILLWIAGGLVAVLALLALFLIGTRIAHLFGPSPAVVASPSPTPSPTPSETVPAVGPVPPGTYAWDELLGTECLEPYESPWQEQYTVVDCAEPHAAQLVTRGTFPEEPSYPGVEQLASRMNLLCTDPSVIEYSVTAGLVDLQFAASFAATAQEWDEGHHDYFCFVNRANGEPITGSIAKPPAPPAEPAP